MVENIIQMALEGGIWAALFCFLFLYQLKNSKEREEKYTETMITLADGVKNIALLEEDTDAIKADVAVIKSDVDTIKDDALAIKGFSAEILSNLREIK